MSVYPNSGMRGVELGYATDEKVTYNFFNVVYAWMAVGLAVTGAVAYGAAAMRLFPTPGLALIVLLGTFALSIAIQRATERISPAVATALFLVYAGIIGYLISYIFVIYSLSTLAAAFFLTAGTFGGMSVYGFVTRRDLTRIGSILVMCALGLFIASVINFFVASNAFSWVITYAVLFVFIGLTAYHTQQLKEMAAATQGNARMAARYAIVGSLVLYLAFINIFLSILRILGDRR
jgi:uncharacterized protein